MGLSRRQKILQAGPKAAAASKICRSHRKALVFEEIIFENDTNLIFPIYIYIYIYISEFGGGSQTGNALQEMCVYEDFSRWGGGFAIPVYFGSHEGYPTPPRAVGTICLYYVVDGTFSGRFRRGRGHMAVAVAMAVAILICLYYIVGLFEFTHFI